MKASLWIGIHRHGAGWRAVVSQGRSRAPVVRQFPLNTPPETMQRWRADAKAAVRLTRKQRANRGTFEGDARAYLRAVTALPTYQTRVQHIEEWIAIFGTRPRDSIAALEIRVQRDRWLTEPRGRHAKTGDPLPPYAASSVNHRLRALSNLYTVLDAGTGAPNPVRLVPEADEPPARPRALPYALVEQILDALPDRGRPTGQGKGTRPKESQTKARLRVLAYTGLPYRQLQQLQRADVDLEHGRLRLPGRRKGRGADATVIPLTPQAIAAFREFDRLHCWGSFSTSSVLKSFKRAAAKLNLRGITVYDATRHSFGSALFRATRDLDTVRALMNHESTATTRRYVMEAEADALAAILEQAHRALGRRK